MKNKNIIKVSIVSNIVLMIIILNALIGDKSIIKEKQIIKEMTQSENESNLQTQLDNLNTAQEEYANNVQIYKKQIADAITNEGVATSQNDTGAVMATNIGKILSTKTTATATAEDIKQGKTAWVNGQLINGTASNPGIMSLVTKSYKLRNTTIIEYTFEQDYRTIMVSASSCRPNGTGNRIWLYLNDELVIGSDETYVATGSIEIPENETYPDIYNSYTSYRAETRDDDITWYYSVITLPIYNIKAGDVIKVRTPATNDTNGSVSIWSFE